MANRTSLANLSNLGAWLLSAPLSATLWWEDRHAAMEKRLSRMSLGRAEAWAGRLDQRLGLPAQEPRWLIRLKFALLVGGVLLIAQTLVLIPAAQLISRLSGRLASPEFTREAFWIASGLELASGLALGAVLVPWHRWPARLGLAFGFLLAGAFAGYRMCA